jgi:hypothetical protein
VKNNNFVRFLVVTKKKVKENEKLLLGLHLKHTWHRGRGDATFV